jgi:tetratricopeptide (TPR) repeat protein
MYQQLGRTDSAIYYYKKLEETGNPYAQQEAFKALANFYLSKGSGKEAMRYSKLYVDITDSIQEITATETVSRIHAMYNYQKQMSDNARLRIANTHKRNMLIFISVIVICLLLLLYALWQKYRYNKTELDLQMRKLQELQSQYTSSTPSSPEKAKNMLYATNIYTRIQQLIAQGATMNDIDWLQLENAIHQIYEHFMAKLTSVCKLSTQERRVCLLLKAGITPVNIATLTARSKQAINNTRSRLFERTFRHKGSPSEWDQFIQEL